MDLNNTDHTILCTRRADGRFRGQITVDVVRREGSGFVTLLTTYSEDEASRVSADAQDALDAAGEYRLRFLAEDLGLTLTGYVPREL